MSEEQTRPLGAAVPSATLPRAGRYEGANPDAAIVIRVDASAVSADIYRDPAGARDWVASLRTAPGASLTAGAAWPIVAQDGLGATATGRITATAGAGDTATVLLRLDGPLNGVPGNRDIAFQASRADDFLREMGIEIETEDGIAPPAPFDFGGREVTIENCLADAGFEVSFPGQTNRIPAKPGGWDPAQLHTLMADFAQSSLEEKAWRLHLLLLGRSIPLDGGGTLLGIMFDDTAVLPRQGVAIFAGSIREIPDIDHDRKLIQTSVHELGHALNLAHRFERIVGRADSTSFMNYDWRYLGGDNRTKYWQNFRFTFDPDELSFLRHGPRSALIPGGDAFHSVRYWNEGTGGYSPYVPEEPLQGWTLELSAPQAGRLLAFAQPVFLEVKLTNHTGQPQQVPQGLLDPKGGILELLVRRSAGVSLRSLADAQPFQPILQRCYDTDEAAPLVIPDGGSITENVNLTYGTSGFPFAEPGAYEVTALLAVPQQDRELVLRSRTLPIRIAAPQSIDEDRDALDLFRDDVGVYLALGGNRNLAQAHDRLQGIVERRGEDMSDPVVAAIVRAQALDARREYVRMYDGGFRTTGAEPGRAAELLGRLDERALLAFDAETAKQTRALAVR
jgi:hypothetical protein